MVWNANPTALNMIWQKSLYEENKKLQAGREEEMS